MNRRCPAGGGALFAEVSNDLVAGNGLYRTAFQVVIAAVEHFERLRELVEITGKGVLGQLVEAASGFRNPTVDLGLQLGIVQVHFRGFKIREKPEVRQKR